MPLTPLGSIPSNPHSYSNKFHAILTHYPKQPTHSNPLPCSRQPAPLRYNPLPDSRRLASTPFYTPPPPATPQPSNADGQTDKEVNETARSKLQ